MYSEKEVTKRIKEVYKKSKLSQKEFAKRIGVTEATAGYYLERGCAPSVHIIATICEKFDVSADWLLLGRGKRHSNQ